MVEKHPPHLLFSKSGILLPRDPSVPHSTRRGKTEVFPLASFVCVRAESDIPKTVLQFFKADPRTHRLYRPAERLFYAQVILHEIDEGSRQLAQAGYLEEAKILNNFSNSMHLVHRLEFLRRLLEKAHFSEQAARRAHHAYKVRNNQWGGVMSHLGPHPVVAITESGIDNKERNEDAFLLMSTPQAMALVDGMGGHASGHIASCIAIDFFEDAIKLGMEIEDAVVYANEAILTRARHDPQLGGMRPMGCTLAAVHLQKNLFKAAYVGDTKILLIRQGKIHWESQDHTQGQELLREKLIDCETAWELNHILQRWLGFDSMRAARDVSVATQNLKPGDRILLVTDGITDNFFSEDFCLEELARLAGRGSHLQAAQLLIEQCRQRICSGWLPNQRPAKKDNYSLILLEFEGN